MWYVEILIQTHNDVDRTFYDAIKLLWLLIDNTLRIHVGQAPRFPDYG